MLNSITKVGVLFTLFAFTFLQAQSVRETLPIITVTGEEVGSVDAKVIQTTLNHKFEPVESFGQTFDIHNITNVATGYDFQSNGCSQEVWYDINNDLLHSIFTWSNETSAWTDRTTKYFFSGDQGVSWIELGNVPTDGARSGFPAISGLSTGAAVIVNHSAEGGTPTRAKIFMDNSPGEFNLTVIDPGSIASGDPIWPRVTVDLNDNVHIIASENSTTTEFSYHTRIISGVLDTPYVAYTGDVAEAYSMAVSTDGKIGHAYKGDDFNNEADIFYRESTDNGTTWSTPLKIYDGGPSISDTAFGVIRGPNCNFNGEEPVVVFEDARQQYAASTFSPSEPNHVYFWSPNVNGGDPMVIADSSNTPWALNLGTNDVLVPFCRPVIGRTQSDNGYLFVAFMASTDNIFPSPDTTSYFAGYFLWSADGGNNWSAPVKMTPEGVTADGEPLLDWRYPSIAPVNPVSGGVITVHMTMQGDTIPGSNTNALGMPVAVSAQYYHISTNVMVVVVDDDVVAPTEFLLVQNYPNPFNPSTKITYSLAAQGPVSLKVYDILGNEIATLVNTTQAIGVHEVDFNATNLASGLYFYTLKAGSFTSTKKMVLLK